MNKIQQDVNLNPSINWERVKEVICGLESTIRALCEELPVGTIKTILCGIASILSMVCKHL